MSVLIGLFIGLGLGYYVEHRRFAKALRIVKNIVGKRSCEQEARTPCHPDNDNYHTGWSDCAALIRGVLRREMGIRLWE